MIDKVLAKQPEDRYPRAMLWPGRWKRSSKRLNPLPLSNSSPCRQNRSSRRRPRRNAGARRIRAAAADSQQAPAAKARGSSKPLLLGCGGCLLAVLVAAGGLVYLASVGFPELFGLHQSGNGSRQGVRRRHAPLDASARRRRAGRAFPPSRPSWSAGQPRHDPRPNRSSTSTLRADTRRIEARRGPFRYTSIARTTWSVSALMTRVYEKGAHPGEGNAKRERRPAKVRGDPNSPPLIYSHEPIGEKGRYGIFWWKQGWLLHAAADSPMTSADTFLTHYLLAQTVLVKEPPPKK